MATNEANDRPEPTRKRRFGAMLARVAALAAVAGQAVARAQESKRARSVRPVGHVYKTTGRFTGLIDANRGTYRRTTPRRNAKCPCGSKRAFKRCHGVTV